jgi:hypothetical protein
MMSAAWRLCRLGVLRRRSDRLLEVKPAARSVTASNPIGRFDQGEGGPGRVSDPRDGLQFPYSSVVELQSCRTLFEFYATHIYFRRVIISSRP